MADITSEARVLAFLGQAFDSAVDVSGASILSSAVARQRICKFGCISVHRKSIIMDYLIMQMQLVQFLPNG